MNRRMMVEQSETQRPYVVAHDKIRDVVYTEAGEARRRIFHHRALMALESKVSSPAELTHHAMASQQLDRAFSYALAAGDEAMQLSAVLDALIHYDAAYQLLQDNVSTKAEEATRLYMDRGRALELCGQFDTAVDNYEEMATTAQTVKLQTLMYQ